MHVPEWFVCPFDMKIDNRDYQSDITVELIEMYVDIEAKALFKCKNLSE